MIEFNELTYNDLSFLNEIRNECCEIYLHNSNKFTLDQTIAWFEKEKPKFWIIKSDGIKIGYFRTSNYSIENKNIYIGADIHKDFRNKKLGYESYSKFIPFLFEKFNLHKISLEVLETNKRAIALYKKLGFKTEGIKRDEVLKNNNWVNSIIMSIMADEYTTTNYVPKIVVLTTLYNGENYIGQCIGSILSQNFKNFVCYVTDDMSTDNSVNIAKNAINNDLRFKIIQNEKKLYQMGNYDQVIRTMPDVNDEDIIVEVDGDDWLPDRYTLQRIYNIYQNNDCWVAYGNFKYPDGRIGFASPPKNWDNIRAGAFYASHIRTWKAFLWKEMKDHTMKDENGNYWNASCDVAFMYAMLEMAGPDHFKYMSDINYVYNDTNPLNEHKVMMQNVTRNTAKLNNLPKYNRLIKL